MTVSTVSGVNDVSTPSDLRSGVAGALNHTTRPRILGHRPRPPIVRGARHGVPVVRRRQPVNAVARCMALAVIMVLSENGE